MRQRGCEIRAHVELRVEGLSLFKDHVGFMGASVSGREPTTLIRIIQGYLDYHGPSGDY